MKTTQNVKNSLKFRAKPKSGLLSVRVGVKKYTLPVDVRLIAGGDYMFVSFGQVSEIYKLDSGKLVAMDSEANAEDAYNALSPMAKKRGTRRRSSQEMPEELAAALSMIPPGYKLGYDSTGKARLVKLRTRKSKKAQ
jgi:hypothetical protein